MAVRLMAMKTPLNWEKHDHWHFAICGSCLNNSHDRVEMIRKKIKSTGNPDCEGEVELWICPVCGHCREL